MADETLAQIGSTATLSYWNVAASPDAYAELAPIRSIAGIGVERAEVDSTTLDSTAVERIGGLPDGKEVTITLTAATSTVDLISGWVDDGDPIDFRIVFDSPLSETRYFSMTPLGYEFSDITPSELLELELTGRITGGISATDPHA